MRGPIDGVRSWRRSRARVLRDPALDRQLHRLGYAVVPVVSAVTAAEVLEVHRQLRPEPAIGFEADLTNPDRVHREAVRTEVEARLGPGVDAVLDGHQPFLWNFLCKWPTGDEAFYFHRDWMFVDERAGWRSYLLWIALQDVEGNVGVLRVLPGSHHMPRTPVGTHVSPAWLQHTDVIDEAMVSVPVPAGHAVVFDHALVHGSHRNESGVPRVAVGCAVRPVQAPLVHFRREGAELTRFDVDEEFFVTYTPQGLMAEPPPETVGARGPVAEHDLGADQLRVRLARLGGSTIR